MPNKEKIESLPKGVRIVKFEVGEFPPMVVASKNIEKIVIGYSAKTAANDRSQKRGPRYYMVGGTPYYLVKELVEHFTQNPVETTD